jgi:hypothetical protein
MGTYLHLGLNPHARNTLIFKYETKSIVTVQ